MSAQAAVLLQQWLAHAADDGTAANSLLAAYRVDSPLGRFAVVYAHCPFIGWLGALARADGMADWPTQIRSRSPAATTMIAQQFLCPFGAKRRRLPDDTRAALIDYYNERIALLEETARLFAKQPAHRKLVEQHTGACRRALRRLNGEEVAPRRKLRRPQ
ncbi:MAG: hypothetical protein J2P48_11690 [Alphaproteobacteria bacterium]|nr:hypothetical protein [Alphaproteobacteria bacterium]